MDLDGRETIKLNMLALKRHFSIENTNMKPQNTPLLIIRKIVLPSLPDATTEQMTTGENKRILASILQLLLATSKKIQKCILIFDKSETVTKFGNMINLKNDIRKKIEITTLDCDPLELIFTTDYIILGHFGTYSELMQILSKFLKTWGTFNLYIPLYTLQENELRKMAVNLNQLLSRLDELPFRNAWTFAEIDGVTWYATPQKEIPRGIHFFTSPEEFEKAIGSSHL